MIAKSNQEQEILSRNKNNEQELSGNKRQIRIMALIP
jgi:hypothetical protein